MPRAGGLPTSRSVPAYATPRPTSHSPRPATRRKLRRFCCRRVARRASARGRTAARSETMKLKKMTPRRARTSDSRRRNCTKSRRGNSPTHRRPPPSRSRRLASDFQSASATPAPVLLHEVYRPPLVRRHPMPRPLLLVRRTLLPSFAWRTVYPCLYGSTPAAAPRDARSVETSAGTCAASAFSCPRAASRSGRSDVSNSRCPRA
mmetsp:Transcript_13220/g.32272  ORF Transcript_13220/g.32272 Transcript_13220/m.32272 type:complete len:205 (+) Transcript_13220:2164-2778(+)